jgi:hypothetical protein
MEIATSIQLAALGLLSIDGFANAETLKIVDSDWPV